MSLANKQIILAEILSVKESFAQFVYQYTLFLKLGQVYFDCQ